MILADTSVWVAHFRVANFRLRELVEEQQILRHDFVIGELACGNLSDRRKFLIEFWDSTTLASSQQVLDLIEAQNLQGLGIGWIDLHLLTSALLMHAQLWTLDTRLAKAAAEFGIAYP